MATVKFHDAHKTAPILTKGTVSPAVLAQLLQYFNSYFHKCKISNEDKVRNVLMSFEDIKIDNWIKNNQDQFLADDYTFETFTAELRKRFLDPHWESSIVRTIVNSQMTSHESFSTFVNRVMQGNNLLIGTTSRLDSTALRLKLELNMSTYLADKLARLRPADKERIAAITIFEDWLSEVTLLDDEITADLKHIADFATEHIAKKQRSENAQKPPVSTPYPQQPNRNVSSYPPPLSGANAVTPNLIRTNQDPTSLLIIHAVVTVDPTINVLSVANAHAVQNCSRANTSFLNSITDARGVGTSTSTTAT